MNLTEASSHPLVQYAKRDLWGSGIISIPPEFEAEFYSLPASDRQLIRTFFTAATTSCPVPMTLAEDMAYGPEYQEARYSQVNFIYRYLKERVIPAGLSFGNAIDISNLGGRGKSDEGWVPTHKQNILEGPSTYFGYLIPRLVIDILNKATSFKGQKDCYFETDPAAWLLILEGEISGCRDLCEVVLVLINQLDFLQVDIEAIKSRVFDPGYSLEVPAGYLEPIYHSLNESLSSELQFHD